MVRCSTHKSKQFVEKNKLHYDLWNLPEATRNLPFAKVGSMPPGKNSKSSKSSKSAKSRATTSSKSNESSKSSKSGQSNWEKYEYEGQQDELD